MDTPRKDICFVLLPGLAPDSLPVEKLAALLKRQGYASIATNFFGTLDAADFSKITAADAVRSVDAIIRDAKKKYEKVVGVGISLGGAILLEQAKTSRDLDAIVSIGTPFRLKNPAVMRLAAFVAPFVYFFWKPYDKLKKGRRPFPVGAVHETVTYMQGDFLRGLEKIKTNILFVQSKKDQVVDYRALEAYAAKCTQASTEIIISENGTHVMDDHPEVILGYIEAFLKKI